MFGHWPSVKLGNMLCVEVVIYMRITDDRRFAGALWGITSYFNWRHFATKRINYNKFRTQFVKTGVRLLTIECALNGEPFELSGVSDVIQVRTNSIMWQKERLLNIALEYLGHECRFVAWIDCDVLLQNPRWHIDTERALESACVIQMFGRVARLTRDALASTGSSKFSRGFVDALRDSLEKKGAPASPGDTGFAWAARREVLEAIDGLYDAAIVGGADRLMAQAWFGASESPIARLIAVGELQPHYENWARRAYKVVQGSVSSIQGDLLHLWHGEISNRLYLDRHQQVASLGFDPMKNLVKNFHGCWEWCSSDSGFQQWMESYFMKRREDG